MAYQPYGTQTDRRRAPYADPSGGTTVAPPPPPPPPAPTYQPAPMGGGVGAESPDFELQSEMMDQLNRSPAPERPFGSTARDAPQTRTEPIAPAPAPLPPPPPPVTPPIGGGGGTSPAGEIPGTGTVAGAPLDAPAGALPGGLIPAPPGSTITEQVSPEGVSPWEDVTLPPVEPFPGGILAEPTDILDQLPTDGPVPIEDFPGGILEEPTDILPVDPLDDPIDDPTDVPIDEPGDYTDIMVPGEDEESPVTPTPPTTTLPDADAIFEEGADALEARLERGREQSTRRIREQLAARGIYGDESSPLYAQLGDLESELNVQRMEGLSSLNRERYGFALDARAQELQKYGIDASTAYQYAALEQDADFRQKALDLQRLGLDLDQSYRLAQLAQQRDQFGETSEFNRQRLRAEIYEMLATLDVDPSALPAWMQELLAEG